MAKIARQSVAPELPARRAQPGPGAASEAPDEPGRWLARCRGPGRTPGPTGAARSRAGAEARCPVRPAEAGDEAGPVLTECPGAADGARCRPGDAGGPGPAQASGDDAGRTCPKRARWPGIARCQAPTGADPVTQSRPRSSARRRAVPGSPTQARARCPVCPVNAPEARRRPVWPQARAQAMPGGRAARCARCPAPVRWPGPDPGPDGMPVKQVADCPGWW